MSPSCPPPHSGLFHGWRSGRCLVALTLTALLAGCGGGNGAAPAAGGARAMPPPEVGVVVVAPQSVALQTELPGRVSAVRQAQVRARVNGVVVRRLFREGSDVQAGEALYQIDAATYQATLDSAQASLAKAQANLAQAAALAERYQPLAEAQAVSRQELVNAQGAQKQAEADVAAARAAVQLARINLEYATVRAPIAGRIGPSLVSEGALVSQTEATQLAVIQQVSTVYVNFTQSTAEVLQLRKALAAGQLRSAGPGAAAVRVVLEDGSELPRPGRLLFSDLSVDASTGQITLRAEVPNPGRPAAAGAVRPGAAGTGGAAWRPSCCRSRRSRGHRRATRCWWSAPTASRAAPVKRIGGSQGAQWVVLGGLQAGEQVIVEGFQKMMAPGAPVKPVPWPWRSSSSTGRSSPGSSRCSSWCRRGGDHAAAGGAVPHGGAAAIVITAAYPGASAKTLEDSGAERHRAGDERLARADLHGVGGQANGSGASPPPSSPAPTRPGPGRCAEPPVARHAAPAAGGDAAGRAGGQGALELPAVHHRCTPTTQARPGGAGRLRARNVLPEIQRVPGVGQAQLFGTERAMRIWLDPAKLVGYNLAVAGRRHRRHPGAERAGLGRHHRRPAQPAGQTIFATVVVNGQLASAEQFGAIVLRANTDGSSVRLRDVARIELGAQAYATVRAPERQAVRRHRRAAFAHRQRAGHRQRGAQAHGRAAALLPEGVKYSIPYDSSKFVNISISKVVETLLEAVALVFLVMLLFLQKLRYTLIPTIVVPVALLGTFGCCWRWAFSINVLTMFGMVLVIGILVDDAIVVVENVERIMSEEGLPRARPPARRWARSPAPSSASPWCWSRCSCRWPSSAARWATSTASSR
jgi:membrane fusion protein (multidrug efflux system)